jgi:hypothetical protein
MAGFRMRIFSFELSQKGTKQRGQAPLPDLFYSNSPSSSKFSGKKGSQNNQGEGLALCYCSCLKTLENLASSNRTSQEEGLAPLL